MIACAALLAGYNAFLDPFGVFGDRVLNWYGYNMSLNPQVAKLEYLDRNHENYDSYVIGSDRVSAMPMAELDAYLGGRSYNLAGGSGDLAGQRDLVRYIVENYKAKAIILAVEPQNAAAFGVKTGGLRDRPHYQVDGSPAWAFYLRYLFANPKYGWGKLLASRERSGALPWDGTCIAEDGSLDGRLRDALPIETPPEAAEGEGTVSREGPAALPYVEKALEAVADIQALCVEEGVRLILLGVPLHEDEFLRYDQEGLGRFWRGLADVADFYDFWGRSFVNRDVRYYDDAGRFRSTVGTMMLAYVFQDPDAYVPEGFGHLATPANVEERITETWGVGEEASPYTAEVPILMYHAFTEDPEAATSEVAYVGDFEAQVMALKEAGYHPVLYRDLVGYVCHGEELPENPIVLTMDDGYQSDLDLAVPILEREGFCATIAVIGCSMGKDTYKDTGTPINPHFALEDAAPYVESGVLDIQTHSYDMHQVKKLDGEDCRFGVLRMTGETEEEYIGALAADFLRSKEQLQSVLDVDCNVYTYPYGVCDALSEAVLHGLGIQVSVTVDPGVNELVKGLPQSLYQMKRINVAGGMGASELLDALAEYRAGG